MGFNRFHSHHLHEGETNCGGLRLLLLDTTVIDTG